MIYLIMIVGISLLISALCSLLEACLLSMSHTDIAEISENSPKMDTIWNNFKDNIQKPIAVILIINTISHTTGASIAGAQFDELFGSKWIIAFSFIFSFAMIQWSEILPKTLGVRYNKEIAIIGTYPLVLLIKIFTPFIKLIELLNKPFVKKIPASNDGDIVKEIAVLSHYAFINKLISKDQEQIITRTITLSQKKVKDIMIPRDEMKVLYDNMTLMNALVEAHIHNHTRYPLIRHSNQDEVMGYVNFKDIVSALQINPDNPSLKGIARPILIINDEDSFLVLFKKLTRSRQHICIVKDMHNNIVGMVTLEDVIEEIIGELEDEYDELPLYFYPITKTRYLVGGGVKIHEINERIGSSLDDEDLNVDGWMKKHFGFNLKGGDKYNYTNYNFIIKKMVRSKVSELILEKSNE